jgi:ornithine carbamoyltransferase
MMKGKDLLTLMEFDSRSIAELLEIASDMKRDGSGKDKGRGRGRGKGKGKGSVYAQSLAGKVLAMIFQKPSTRTRVSFDLAMHKLGGHTITLNASEIQLSRGESIEDTARTLSCYVDAIGARVYNHEDVVKLANAASVPVINMLSDLYHPCQVLGDLLTIKEVKGRLSGLTLAWVGDGNNVCNSMVIGCSLVGIVVNVACPKNYEPIKDALDFAIEHNGSVNIMEDPKEAVSNSDIVYTDSFVSMGKESERDERLKVFLPRYQVNDELISLAREDAIFMHCLPAKRGEEVTDSVIDSNRSVVWLQAENRMHAQKALLYMLMSKDRIGIGESSRYRYR